MEFISTEGMTPDTAPENKCLIIYLRPFFGIVTTNVTVGYYDNPKDYKEGGGDGWLTWDGNHKCHVVAYYELPHIADEVFIPDRLKTLSQATVFASFDEYGSLKNQ
jgi:hypothetical protein